MSNIQVTGLYIYPLKSARGLSVAQLNMDERGPLLDREWMLIDEAHNFVSQRTQPKMSLIHTALTESHLFFTVKGQETISVPLSKPAQTAALRKQLTVKIFGKEAQSFEESKTLSQWFSDYLSKNVRCVRAIPEAPRLSSSKYDTQQAPLKFADGFPLLLATEESLEDFNSKLNTPITMNHFRPNIVVKGAPAFSEDNWRHLQIGDGRFEGVKDCSRCSMVTVFPDTGIKDKQIMKTLTQHRFKNGKVLFGKNLSHRSQTPIRLGDAVVVKSPEDDA